MLKWKKIITRRTRGRIPIVNGFPKSRRIFGVTSLIKEYFDRVVKTLAREAAGYYGNRLISLAIFGSVARGTYRPDSDIDLLLVVDRLPRGRIKRIAEFMRIEKRLEKILKDTQKQGLSIELSPIIKSPDEAGAGSPLFLDMVEDIKVLYDKDCFLRNRLKRLKARLDTLGAKRVWRGNAWYWDLKPDFKPGDVIEL